MTIQYTWLDVLLVVLILAVAAGVCWFVVRRSWRANQALMEDIWFPTPHRPIVTKQDFIDVGLSDADATVAACVVHLKDRAIHVIDLRELSKGEAEAHIERLREKFRNQPPRPPESPLPPA